MAEELTLARPYAEAVFKLALESGGLERWSETLQFLSAVEADPAMQQLTGNPKVQGAQLTETIRNIGAGRLDADAGMFVQVLVENRRIPLLPQIAEQFEHLKQEHEGILEATIASAFPIDDQQLRSLVQDLEKRFKRRVQASVTIDPSLIGGVRMTVGDVVIDGSVRAQLDQMATALKR